MAPKANLLTTDEVAGVMKTAMEKPRAREASAEVAHCTFTPRTNSCRAKFAVVQPRIDCGPRRTSPAAQRPPSPARDAPPPLAATRPPPARGDDDGDVGWVSLARS